MVTPNEWKDLHIPPFPTVRTSTSLFMRIGAEKIAELVAEFMRKNPKQHEYGRNVMVDDAQEEQVGNIRVMLIFFTSPEGLPTILCDDKEHLAACGTLKRSFAYDGQNKHGK